MGCDLCGSGFWVGGCRWVDFNMCDFGRKRHGLWMQQRGSGGATTWAIGAAAWVCFLTVSCGVFFFFFLGVDSRLWVAGGGVRCV